MKIQWVSLIILGFVLCASTARAGAPRYDARGNLIEMNSNSPSAAEQSLESGAESIIKPEQAAVSKETPSEDVEPAKESDVYGGIGLGVAPINNGYDPSYVSGFGGEAFLGVKMDDNWSLMADLDCYEFDSSYSGWFVDQIDLVAAIRYTLGTKGIRPYLFVGGGMGDSLQTQSSTLLNSTGPVVAGGVGLDLAVNTNLTLFIQGKCDINFNLDGSASYFPLSAGIQFN